MSKYKVGDRVRVREWEDMAKKFGINGDGNIKSRILFVRDMKLFCGKTVTISNVGEGYYRIKEDNGSWRWTNCMLVRTDFCLDDITDEMIIELRNGRIYLALGENFVRKEGYIKKSDYDKNLKSSLNSSWDIVAVYPPSRVYGYGFTGMLEPNSEPIWEEKKLIEISEPERIILENIDDKYRWIARDKDGDVCVYANKPTKKDDIWGGSSLVDLNAFNHLFQFVRWTDEKPVNFREVLKGE